MVTKGDKYLHDNNIIHRDLKPDIIIIIGNDGLLKIIDFGISSFHMLINDDAIEYGTVPYDSPEHYEKEKLSPKVDIYSIGIIFLEVFGSFNTQMERAQTIMKLKENGEMNINIEENLKSLIRKMTNKDSSKRPNADEVISALESLL